LILLFITGCAAISDKNSGDHIDQIRQTTPNYASQAETADQKSVLEEEQPGHSEKSNSQKPTQTTARSNDEPDNAIQKDKASQTVSLLVTREFKKETLFNQKVVMASGNSALDLIKTHLAVETSYGGGFIHSINGLEGGSKGGVMYDWFYYVNGISPSIGSSDYKLNPGDVVWWDYHRWQTGSANPAVIGSYPEPFLHGYQGKVKGTSIMCTNSHIALANRLMGFLQNLGVANVQITDIKEELLTKPQGPIIVIGEWGELSKFQIINQINQNSARRGIPVHFTDGALELMNYQGQVSKTITTSAGVITATASGFGDCCPIWLVAGTDPSGLSLAVDTLIKPGAVWAMHSALVIPGQLIPLPLD
jgi:hypothetical protein